MFETKKAASKKNAIKFLKDVLMIESVSGNELELARYLKRFLEQSDYQILSSKVGNVIGIKGSGDPVLMLASHMDTVPTDNPFRVVGDKIYATGATDCKPSLASMFYAASKEEWKEGE